MPNLATKPTAADVEDSPVTEEFHLLHVLLKK